VCSSDLSEGRNVESGTHIWRFDVAR